MERFLPALSLMELFHVKSPGCRSNTSSRNPPQHAAEGYRETERITQRRRRDSNCQFARLGQLRVVRFWRKHQPIDRLATCSRGHHEQNRTPETPAPGVRPNFKPKAIRVTIQNTIICTRTRDKGAEKEARNLNRSLEPVLVHSVFRWFLHKCFSAVAQNLRPAVVPMEDFEKSPCSGQRV